jgi:hypothetical protein
MLWLVVGLWALMVPLAGRMVYGHALWMRCERFHRPKGPTTTDYSDAWLQGVVWGLLWPLDLVLYLVVQVCVRYMTLAPMVGAERREFERQRLNRAAEAEKKSDEMEKDAGL